ncbi:M23 family metallopeptidase [Candidatus Uhrbacteria bacterium]|nr:M23 family metallopeptidase [Candidatus Uhrbacteria bacterium]
MFFQRLPSYLFLSTAIVGALTLVLMSGCEPFDVSHGGDPTSSDQGGGEGALNLPLELDHETMCTQGAHGSHSHSSTATEYDLDFDTDNYSDEEVYAPISGTAYVHLDATSGFGIHVNIDLGNGTYVVLGHFKKIFVSDGDEIAVGQLLGYEGNTGISTGDHIHIGLHQGDAREDAGNGVSIPTQYWAANASDRGQAMVIDSEDFVCGIASEGDAYDGDFYESQLKVPLWHPDGTLVKTGDNARVYVLEDSAARWIENEDVFWSRNWDFNEVVLISDEELECLGEGADIMSEGFVDAAFDTEEQLWLIVGTSSDSDRYRARVRGTGWEAVMESWGLDYGQGNYPDTYDDTSSYMANWLPSDSYVGLRDGTLVKEEDASDVWAIVQGTALPIVSWDTYLQMGLLNRTIITVSDGVVGELATVGSCSADKWCLDEDAVTTCGGGLDLTDGGSTGGSSDSDDDDESDSSDPSDSSDEEADVSDEDTDASDPPDEEDAEEADDEGEDVETVTETDCDGEDACIVDGDGDGIDETLLMADDLWLTGRIDGEAAYVYGNGGCYNGTLSSGDLMYTNGDGYYEIDFSAFAYDCEVQMSLINSEGTDGEDPDSTMNNWYWWQGADFCAAGSDLCELMDNDTSWEEWLIYVSWDPSSGLEGIGNGYTDNSEL